MSTLKMYLIISFSAMTMAVVLHTMVSKDKDASQQTEVITKDGEKVVYQKRTRGDALVSNFRSIASQVMKKVFNIDEDQTTATVAPREQKNASSLPDNDPFKDGDSTESNSSAGRSIASTSTVGQSPETQIPTETGVSIVSQNPNENSNDTESSQNSSDSEESVLISNTDSDFVSIDQTETTVEETTSSSTSSSSSSSSSSSTSDSNESLTVVTDTTTISCEVDKSPGTYSANISVSISCSEYAQIYYCLQKDSGSCNPEVSGVLYAGAIDINAGDGNYYLSFYGESASNGDLSEITDASYTLNSLAPNLSASFPIVMAQTTELPFINQTGSTDFGSANHFYHQINYRSIDPIDDLSWSCSDIFYNYSSLAPTTPVIIQANYDVSGLLVTDQIQQAVDGARLQVGDNHIVTILEDRGTNNFSCQAQNVVVKDFHTASFTATGATPVNSGVRQTTGSFVGMGHFQLTPNTSDTGDLENTKTSTMLKQGIATVLY